MHEQLIEQRAAMERFNRRVADLRQEMAGGAICTRRSGSSFGPELTPGGRDKGAGGPAREPIVRPDGCRPPRS